MFGFDGSNDTVNIDHKFVLMEIMLISMVCYVWCLGVIAQLMAGRKHE